MIALTLIALLATPPAERVGAFVEGGAGPSLCGGHGDVDCDGAGVGVAFELRGGYRPLPYLAIAGHLASATLPADDVPTGQLWFVGPEVMGVLPLAPVDLQLGLAVGYNQTQGTHGDYGGFGALRARLGARVSVIDRLYLGGDYGLLIPHTSDTVRVGAQRYHIETAWLHQVMVVAGVPFW
ncbi:MAG: hypothetical protein KC620_09475 [Myxococcales bacterium]|nr:hypothetical protein [Myxococcales bacterium]